MEVLVCVMLCVMEVSKVMLCFVVVMVLVVGVLIISYLNFVVVCSFMLLMLMFVLLIILSCFFVVLKICFVILVLFFMINVLYNEILVYNLLGDKLYEYLMFLKVFSKFSFVFLSFLEISIVGFLVLMMLLGFWVFDNKLDFDLMVWMLNICVFCNFFEKWVFLMSDSFWSEMDELENESCFEKIDFFWELMFFVLKLMGFFVVLEMEMLVIFGFWYYVWFCVCFLSWGLGGGGMWV